MYAVCARNVPGLQGFCMNLLLYIYMCIHTHIYIHTHIFPNILQNYMFNRCILFPLYSDGPTLRTHVGNIGCVLTRFWSCSKWLTKNMFEALHLEQLGWISHTGERCSKCMKKLENNLCSKCMSLTILYLFMSFLVVFVCWVSKLGARQPGKSLAFGSSGGLRHLPTCKCWLLASENVYHQFEPWGEFEKIVMNHHIWDTLFSDTPVFLVWFIHIRWSKIAYAIAFIIAAQEIMMSNVQMLWYVGPAWNCPDFQKSQVVFSRILSGIYFWQRLLVL